MQKAILGKKLGMTQVFAEDGTVIPVTVVLAGPVTVTQLKPLKTTATKLFRLVLPTFPKER